MRQLDWTKKGTPQVGHRPRPGIRSLPSSSLDRPPDSLIRRPPAPCVMIWKVDVPGGADTGGRFECVGPLVLSMYISDSDDGLSGGGFGEAEGCAGGGWLEDDDGVEW